MNDVASEWFILFLSNLDQGSSDAAMTLVALKVRFVLFFEVVLGYNR